MERDEDADMATASNATKLASESNDAKCALYQELRHVIQRMEWEQSPAFTGEQHTKPDPAFPAQLSQPQIITVPCDGLCLCHACIAAYHAREWRDEHGEKGYRIRGSRSQQRAEEHNAHCFLAHVVELMREYAQFDTVRSHYSERASRISNGAMPEDFDMPFYAACLNGCIECVPLGYSDSQGSSVIGAGPLRISVGCKQEKGDDGASAGHFILLQSWLPVETDQQKRGAFPFGVQASGALDLPGAVGFARRPLDSSSYPRRSLLDASCIASPASAAKPAASASSSATLSDAAQRATSVVRGMPLRLDEVLPILHEHESKTSARNLMQDIPKLQKWQSAPKATHEVRDAMLKLGSRWDVPRSSQGKKRPPAEVARELEGRMLEQAKELLHSSVVKPAALSNTSPRDVSAHKIARKATPPRTPLTMHSLFAAQKRKAEQASATDTPPCCVAPRDEALSAQISKVPRTKITRSMPSRSNPQRPDPDHVSEAGGTELHFEHLPSLLRHRAEEPLVQRLLLDVDTLLTFQNAAWPSNQQRDAMLTVGSRWNVARTEIPEGKTKRHRQAAHVAKDLKEQLLREAAKLLDCSVELNYWQVLQECTTWIRTHYGVSSDDGEHRALTAMLALIDDWPEFPNKFKNLSQHKPAIKAELDVLYVKRKNMKGAPQPEDLCRYAFAQHALRELRARTSTWAPNLDSTAPTGLAGRAGYEHCRASICEIIPRAAHFPFHLAGDSAVRLFTHRAWLSWRYLALLELPELSLCQLPPLSTQLQHLIETTRSNAQPIAHPDFHAVNHILLSFFHDPYDAGAKARWLRRAMKLHSNCDDARRGAPAWRC